MPSRAERERESREYAERVLSLAEEADERGRQERIAAVRFVWVATIAGQPGPLVLNACMTCGVLIPEAAKAIHAEWHGND